MASKKYRINQTIELATLAPTSGERASKTQSPNPNTSRYRWSLTIHVDDNDVESEPVIAMTGNASNEHTAREKVERFTNFALNVYNLFGRHQDDDDDD
jgi:hypothetical protein